MDDIFDAYVILIRPVLFWLVIAALLGVIVELLRGGVRKRMLTPEEKATCLKIAAKQPVRYLGRSVAHHMRRWVAFVRERHPR